MPSLALRSTAQATEAIAFFIALVACAVERSASDGMI